MAVGVDEARELFPGERALKERKRLRRVRDVARIDHHGLAALLEHDVVRGKPAALDDPDASGELHRAVRRAGSRASTFDIYA